MAKAKKRAKLKFDYHKGIKMTREAAGEELEKIGNSIVTDAKRFCPVGEEEVHEYGGYIGLLQDSIDMEKSKFDKDEWIIYCGRKTNGGDPFYWSYVELGTEQQPMRSFMRKSMRRHKRRG